MSFLVWLFVAETKLYNGLMLAENVLWQEKSSYNYNTHTHTHTLTHTRLTAIFQDYPGEPVPER